MLHNCEKNIGTASGAVCVTPLDEARWVASFPGSEVFSSAAVQGPNIVTLSCHVLPLFRPVHRITSARKGTCKDMRAGTEERAEPGMSFPAPSIPGMATGGGDGCARRGREENTQDRGRSNKRREEKRG